MKPSLYFLFALMICHFASNPAVAKSDPTGACCHPDCTCAIQTQAECEPAGVWYGPGTTCEPNPCGCPPTGACCYPDGLCYYLPPDLCTPPAIFIGFGMPCSPNPCHVASVLPGSAGETSRISVTPNPSAGPVTILFDSSGSGAATLEVFDAGGALVRRIANQDRAAGPIQFRWDGRDDAGHEVPSGVYLARITLGEGTTIARVVVAR